LRGTHFDNFITNFTPRPNPESVHTIRLLSGRSGVRVPHGLYVAR
jgi:hypothetical protein